MITPNKFLNTCCTPFLAIFSVAVDEDGILNEICQASVIPHLIKMLTIKFSVTEIPFIKYAHNWKIGEPDNFTKCLGK